MIAAVTISVAPTIEISTMLASTTETCEKASRHLSCSLVRLR